MVDYPTSIFGRTQSGKTWRAFELFALHNGPAIFADIQWRGGTPDAPPVRAVAAWDVEDVVEILRDAKAATFTNGPKVVWRLDNYDDLDGLVDYLLTVHRKRHLEGRALPKLALFMDETWRAAGRGADATNAAVRIFTEGYQHNIIGVSISQWIAQIARLIPGQAYQLYVFELGTRDVELLRTLYRMEIPRPDWLGRYHYWRYDGSWWRGDSHGVEVRYDETPSMPEVPEPERPETDAEELRTFHREEGQEVESDGVDVPKLRDFREESR